MTVTIRYKRGDTIPLQYAIEEWNIDTQGTEPYDLSNRSVVFSMRQYGTDDWAIEQASCRVVSAVDGLVEYEWAENETDVPGMYGVVFTVINEEGKRTSFPEYGVQALWIIDDGEV